MDSSLSLSLFLSPFGIDRPIAASLITDYTSCYVVLMLNSVEFLLSFKVVVREKLSLYSIKFFEIFFCIYPDVSRHFIKKSKS